MGDVSKIREEVEELLDADEQGNKIMVLLEMDFDHLYRMYVGKNVLNFFRQDHGYKDGSYIKVWGEREDNEHLAELLTTLDSTNPDFRDNVYQGLATRYPG